MDCWTSISLDKIRTKIHRQHRRTHALKSYLDLSWQFPIQTDTNSFRLFIGSVVSHAYIFRVHSCLLKTRVRKQFHQGLINRW